MTSAFQEVANLNPDIEYDIIWRFDFVKGSLFEKLEISKSPHHTGNCEIMWSLNWMGMMLCAGRHTVIPDFRVVLCVPTCIMVGPSETAKLQLNLDENEKTFLVEMRMQATLNTLLGSISKHLILRNLWTLCCSQFCTWSFFLARPASSGKTKIQEISRAVKSLCFLHFPLVLSVGAFSLISGTSVTRQHRNDSSIGTSWEQVLKTSSTPEIQQISCVPGCQRKISCRVAYRWQTRVTFRPFRQSDSGRGSLFLIEVSFRL